MAARSIEELQKRYASLGKVPTGRGGPGGPGPRRGPGGPGMRAKGKPKNSRATVRRLIGYIGAHWFRLVFVLLCMLCSTLTALAGDFLLRDVYNVLTKTADPDSSFLVRLLLPEAAASGILTDSDRLWCLGIVLMVLASIYAVGIVSTYLQGRLMIVVSQNAVEKIRNDLFCKLQKLPVRYFDSHPTGELMSRFTNDVDAIDMMINSSVTNLVSGTITLVGTLALMVYTNWILTLITLAFIPLYLFGGGLIGKKSAKYHVAQQTALGAVNGYIEETVTGSKVVKVFNHEDVCVEEFEALNDDMRDKQFKAHFFGGVMGPIMHNLSNIAMVLQDTHLFSGTIMENIRYGRPDATDDEVIEAAKTASAHSFIMRLEHGYQTKLEGDGANLSQGQRQLLNIARAAISKAPILVLDEATSSVDTRTERHIERGMDRLMKNRTTFVIAHRLSTVRNAAAIMVLEKGEIIERGNHDQLLALKGRYYELYTGKKELD